MQKKPLKISLPENIGVRILKDAIQDLSRNITEEN